MASPAAAVPLGVLPRPSMGEVAVAVALELVPAVVTALRVWEVGWECEGNWPWAKPRPPGHEHSQCTRERTKPKVTVGPDHPSSCPHPPEALPSPPPWSSLPSHIHFSVAGRDSTGDLYTHPSHPNPDVSFSDWPAHSVWPRGTWEMDLRTS